MEREYYKSSNSNRITADYKRLNLSSFMGNQAVLHNFYSVIQRMPEDAINCVPDESRNDLSEQSSWFDIEDRLIKLGAPSDYLCNAYDAYYKGQEENLPTFVVDSKRWPNIAMHTLEFMEQGGEDEIILRYMEERALTFDDPYLSETCRTNRDKLRLQAQTRGQPLVRSAREADTQLDEFPYASTYEGGTDSSIMHIPRHENESHGGALAAFYRHYRLKDGYRFRVIVR